MTEEGLRLLATLPALRELELFGSGVPASAVRALSQRQAGHRLKITMSKDCWWMR